MPVQDSVSGAHPISECTNKILRYFENLNFKTFYGNEIETDFYNFEALNFPKNHPARQMHDTFYVDTQSKDGYLLRTHTSNTQIHSMLEHAAPIYMLSPGECVGAILIQLIFQCSRRWKVWLLMWISALLT